MFARPYFLIALALLVPVIIAFLFKNRDRVATVPSTLLLRRVALVRIKNRRLRAIVQKLGFLACLAAVAGLAIAAADPHPFGSTRTIAVVVDVSASMRGEAMSDARETVARIVRQRAGQERIAIIAAGSEPRHLAGPTDDPALLDAAMDQLHAEGGEADVLAALRLADGLVRERQNARIWLVSDAGAPAFEDAIETVAPLALLRVGARRENLGITVLASRAPREAASDGEREVLVTVAASRGGARRARVMIESEGVELGRRNLVIAGGEEVEATFRLRARVNGLRARVLPIDGRGDDIPDDDRAELSMSRSAPPRVYLIAEGDSPARFFVERAITASGVQRHEVRSPSRAPRRLADGELAVVLDDAPAHRIVGPTLFLATRSGELPVQLAGRLTDARGATALRSIDRQNVLTRGVDLDGATIARASAIHVPQGAASLVELDGGTVVASGGAGRDRWVYMGIEPAESDLVLRVAFPVLMANALTALGGATEVRTARTTPRPEVSLLPSPTLFGTVRLRDRVPAPSTPAFIVAAFAALLLLGEGIAYYRGWSR